MNSFGMFSHHSIQIKSRTGVLRFEPDIDPLHAGCLHQYAEQLALKEKVWRDLVEEIELSTTCVI